MFPSLADLCSSFSYTARPAPGTPARRSYALLSSDLRIHYRDDGLSPGDSDPVVDGTVAASADGLPGGGRLDLSEEEADGLVGAARTAVLSIIDRVFGEGGRTRAAAEVSESHVLRDLRTFSDASVVFRDTAGSGRCHASPTQLSDPAARDAADPSPPLPAHFAQAVRWGYRYEFVGERSDGCREIAQPPRAPLWESFVYIARPIEPGPVGRRAFALYPDGLIYVTGESRVPTRSDALVSAHP